jgi:hypothetical protein
VRANADVIANAVFAHSVPAAPLVEVAGNIQ